MTLYSDLLSPPCRACVLLLRLHNLPVVEHVKWITGKEHEQNTYLKLNPLGMLPFLQDDTLGLPESAAILKYWTRKYKGKIPSHWYPDLATDQATVDALLHWQHVTIRFGSSRLTKLLMLSQTNGALSRNIYFVRKILFKALDTLETYYLKNTPFCSVPTAHSSVGLHPSIADLVISCELEQLIIIKLFPNADEDLKSLHEFANYPRIKQYLRRLEQYCAPHYSVVYETLKKVASIKRARM